MLEICVGISAEPSSHNWLVRGHQMLFDVLYSSVQWVALRCAVFCLMLCDILPSFVQLLDIASHDTDTSRRTMSSGCKRTRVCSIRWRWHSTTWMHYSADWLHGKIRQRYATCNNILLCKHAKNTYVVPGVVAATVALLTLITNAATTGPLHSLQSGVSVRGVPGRYTPQALGERC